ncbi:MAG TPA: hypothetical protein VJ992_05860 [Gemmatimonadales bacterium]|nr:hypothetical protein [Gemmatimonadales bacterium]
MKRWFAALAVAGLVVAGCTDNSAVPTQATAPGTPNFMDVQTGQSHIHIMPTKANAYGLDNQAKGSHGKPGGGGGGKTNTGIYYHGGPIIPSEHVVAIYWASSTIYGGGPTPNTTGSAAQDGSLVGYFLSNLGGSPYYNINTTYYDGSNVHVANDLSYAGFWATSANAPTSGQTVSDGAIQTQIASGFASGALTYDASTVYAVFGGPGVNLGGGFGSSYCAYHGNFSWNGHDVKYAVMPHNYDYPSGCSALSGSPNNDYAADAEVNTLAHELEEANTDPDLNAWYDRRGYENADKCAWKFGSTYTTSNGAVANIQVGSKDFLVQQNWVNAGSGGCLLSY